MYSFSAGALKGQRSINFLLFESTLLLFLISFCMFLNFMFWIQIVYELGNEKIKVEWQWWWWWWWSWMGNGTNEGFLIIHPYIKMERQRKRKGKSFYFYVNVFHCLWTLSLCMLSFFLPILCVYGSGYVCMPMDMRIIAQANSKSERTSFLCNLFYSFHLAFSLYSCCTWCKWCKSL